MPLRPAVTRYDIVLILIGLVFVISNQWVCDDGYIYFRYVDNLIIHDIGLVFNKGELVEGFTSPLWVLTLSTLRFALQFVFSIRQIVFILGWALALVTFVTLAQINRRILIRARTHHFLDLSLPLVLAISTQVIPEFFTSGLETPLVILYSVLVAAQILIPSNNLVYVGLLIGLGPLVRPDLAIFSLLVLIHYFLILKNKGLVRVIVLSALPNVSYLIFRIWYYASFVPNTYFAKASGAYFSQGLRYLKDLVHAYPIHLLFGVLVIVSLIQLLAESKREDQIVRNRLVLIFSILIYSSYVIWLGGDFMHGRFWLPALMLLYVGFSGVIESLSVNIKAKESIKHLINITAIALIMGIMLLSGPIQKGRQIIRGIADERNWHARRGPLFEWNLDTWRRGNEFRRLSERTGEHITIIHGYIGRLAYGAGPNISVIDWQGLTDPVASRTKLRRRRRPGHEKKAPTGYLIWRRPTFWRNTPFEKYDDNFTLVPELELPITDFNPGFISKMEHIYRVNISEEAEKSVGNVLSYDTLDNNFLFLLKTFYAPHANKELKNEIEELYKEEGKSPWEPWFEENREKMEIIEAQMHNRHNLWANITLAILAQRIRFEPQ